jgi:hypothetical protein
MTKSILKSALVPTNAIFAANTKIFQNLIPNKSVSHVLISTWPPLFFCKKVVQEDNHHL